MESSSYAENIEGRFKVTRGHPRSNGLPLSFGHTPWWIESSVGANSYEGKFKVSWGHPRSMNYHCYADLKLGG